MKQVEAAAILVVLSGWEYSREENAVHTSYVLETFNGDGYMA
ncbi:UNVERIFIED_ORG: hypothetical protein FHR35_004970 [Microbispora rosea subsp. rosea]